MRHPVIKLAVSTAAAVALSFGATAVTSTGASAQKKGGVLQFVVPSKTPSYDGHIETTFGTLHPIRPFYSTLIRVNPDNPGSPTDFVCDLCEGKMPEPTDDGKTFTFKIRKGVKFHDGTPLTAHDIVATYQKIMSPPEGVPSARKAFFKMVDKVEAPDDHTVVFRLKFPSGAFVPALATPFNFIYAKKDIAKGYTWHRTNINGTGPFIFVQDQPGAFIEGKRNPNYYFEGKPYLDGFKAVSAPQMALRLQALRGDRAAAEFRGFPPKARDDMVKALGKDIVVQESDWNCVLIVTPNHKRKPLDDVRVRKALSLAVDRWGGSKYLSKIAIVKTVGGVVFPKHPLAATEEELMKLAGYGKDIEKNRAEARRLLKEAGHPNLQIVLNNRGVDQPYKVVGTWLIDQWAKVGVKARQQVQPTPVFHDSLRKKKDFDVSMDFNCQSIVNPIADVSKFIPGGGSNYANFEDAKLLEIYDRLLRAPDQAAQRKIMREFENRVLNELSSQFITLWWYRINMHRSYMKGWKTSPSHYLNQSLENIWIDKG